MADGAKVVKQVVPVTVVCGPASTMETLTVAVLLFCRLVFANAITGNPHAMNFDRLYTLGIASYEEERWFQCVSFMSRSIEEHKHYSDVMYKCRVHCKQDSASNVAKDFIHDHGEQLLSLFLVQDLVKNVECVRRCKLRNLGEGPRAMNIFRSITQAFVELKPYDYLQICAFKTNDLKQAVAAAYTYFLANPNHTVMLSNLQYYRKMPNVHPDDFINLEEKDYQTHYIDGSHAYTEDDWPVVVEEMESALEAYFPAEERCRFECEGLLDTGQIGDVTDALSTIASLYVEMTRCQLGCERKLGVIHAKVVPDYVADHYHYLQYAYFKLKNYEKAAQAAESYLLFKPHDDIMLNNKLYYLKRGYGESFFVARPEAEEYSKRRKMMREVIRLAEETPPEENDTYDVFVKKNYISMGDFRANPSNFEEHSAETQANPFIQHFARIGIQVFADGKVLHGPERFAADGLMRPEQCQELINLAQAQYDNWEKLPTLQQINIPQAVELLKREQVSDLSLRILLRAGEVSRFFLQQYLNLTKVYLQDTKLICRDHADPNSDNKDCYIQEDGSCVTWFPINDKADYVAAIHLNKVMTGGEIYMANENLNGQGMMLSPKCGRMVGFPASTPHGVLPFPSGVRCALVFNYSKNRTHDDKAHSHAFRYLAKLEDSKQEEHLERLRNRKAVLQGIKDSGISVTMTDEDLAGEERVIADDLLSPQECKVLRKLAKTGGLGGDGYGTSGVSPHTENEQFIGLTVGRAAKKGSLTGDGYGDKRYNTQSSISPHTKHETFQGLTVLRAAQLANLAAVDERSVEMYLNMSEKSRDFVEKYFNLESPLYFDFTHLVCRMAIEVNGKRKDLSHPVHADNCILQEDETCVRQFPAYTQRDYSALLYLNDDFEGGDFFFAHANKSEQVSVRPKCGRLAAFNAAAYHGVKAVTKGERCALALWFTLDPDFKEIAHIQARKMLRDRKNDPNYNLPSSSPLFTMPGIPEKETDSSFPGRPMKPKLLNDDDDDEDDDEEASDKKTNESQISDISDRTDKSDGDGSLDNASDDKSDSDESFDDASDDRSDSDEYFDDAFDEKSDSESQSDSSSEEKFPNESQNSKMSGEKETFLKETDEGVGQEEIKDLDSSESDSVNSDTDDDLFSYRNEL